MLGFKCSKCIVGLGGLTFTFKLLFFLRDGTCLGTKDVGSEGRGAIA